MVKAYVTFKSLLAIIKRYWLALTIFNVFVVSALSLTPLEHLPAPSNDKTLHLISYCLLIIPCALARPKHFAIITLCLFLWSGGIELIQPFVNRYAEWLDVIANGIGFLLGIIVASAIKRLEANFANLDNNQQI